VIIMSPQPFMSRELAHFRALDLLDEAQQYRQVRAAKAPRRAARKAALAAWFARLLPASTSPAVVIPAQRAGDEPELAPSPPAVPAEDACR
jgi:hypothetical protein